MEFVFSPSLLLFPLKVAVSGPAKFLLWWFNRSHKQMSLWQGALTFAIFVGSTSWYLPIVIHQGDMATANIVEAELQLLSPW